MLYFPSNEVCSLKQPDCGNAYYRVKPATFRFSLFASRTSVISKRIPRDKFKFTKAVFLWGDLDQDQ